MVIASIFSVSTIPLDPKEKYTKIIVTLHHCLSYDFLHVLPINYFYSNQRIITMRSSQRKAKIKWHCRRGMLELDLIFEHFYTHHIDTLTDEQLNVFEHLLNQPDPDLYAWLMGYEKSADKELADIVAFIRLHDNTQ